MSPVENNSAPLYGLDEIKKILPHRAPFLFVDSVLKIKVDKDILTDRKLLPSEPHFEGHFPNKPIMPGVLITDALAQSCGLLWGLTRVLKFHEDIDTQNYNFFLVKVSMKFTHPAYPNDILYMHCSKEREFDTLHSYKVEATVGKLLIAKGELTLAIMEQDDNSQN